jgi:hypothetical protein
MCWKKEKAVILSRADGEGPLKCSSRLLWLGGLHLQLRGPSARFASLGMTLFLGADYVVSCLHFGSEHAGTG